MSQYVPFLKFKNNEVAAIKALDKDLKEVLTPFFDIPRKSTSMTEQELISTVDKAYRKYEINLKDLPYFYLDNFDIDDNLKINDESNYMYIMEKFSDSKLIPVVGIDRTDERNDAVFEAKKQKIISSDFIALRLTQEDFKSYDLVEDEIGELLDECADFFNGFHLVIDNRVCSHDIAHVSEQIVNFIANIQSKYQFERIIVTGSSIPASIKDLLETETSKTLNRREVEIAKIVKEEVDIDFGDYACVSPDYSDVTFEGGVIRRMTAPKLFYPYDEYRLFIMRGAALDTHPKGNGQYADLSQILTGKAYYRKPAFSFGDKYLHEKAHHIGSDATPSTVPKPLINLHITYLMKTPVI